MFVDKVRIRAKAGNGGNGCVSFRREQFEDSGGPNGGNGGAGGDIILIADKNITDLSDYHFSPRLVADNGGHGQGKDCSGRSGKKKFFKVPIGTQVFRLSRPTRQLGYQRYRPAAATVEDDFKNPSMLGIPHRPGRAKVVLAAAEAGKIDLTPDLPVELPERELVADLVEDGQQYILVNGGCGGRGNTSFKSSSHQTPREFEYGEPGEELHAELELKTLADVGLVGFPNAGKSTLLSKMTRAHPKIAAYPFTTLSPNVGLVDLPNYTRMTMADIPGLIDGAHTGRGLGHDFLRHVERCRLLLILIDMAGVDARKPWDDYRQLLAELKLYNKELLQKPRLVVATKMDLPAAKKNLLAFKKKLAPRPVRARTTKTTTKPAASRTPAPVTILEISAGEGAGLPKLLTALRQALP